MANGLLDPDQELAFIKSLDDETAPVDGAGAFRPPEVDDPPEEETLDGKKELFWLENLDQEIRQESVKELKAKGQTAILGKSKARMPFGEKLRRSFSGEPFGADVTPVEGAIAYLSPVARTNKRLELNEIREKLSRTAGAESVEDELALYSKNFEGWSDGDLFQYVHGSTEIPPDRVIDREQTIRTSLERDKQMLERLTAFDQELEERDGPLSENAPTVMKLNNLLEDGVFGAIDMIPYMIKMAAGPVGVFVEAMTQFDERLHGEGKINEDGRYEITKEQAGVFEAAWKSILSAGAEYYIEKKVGSQLKLLGGKKGAQRFLSAGMQESIEKLSKKMVGKSFGKTGTKLSELTGAKILQGFNPANLFEEIIVEEGLQAVWDAAWNLDNMVDPENPDRKLDFAERQALALSSFAKSIPEMAISFSLFGIGGQGANKLSSIRTRSAQKKYLTELGLEPERQKQIMDEKDPKNRGEMLLQEILSRHLRAEAFGVPFPFAQDKESLNNRLEDAEKLFKFGTEKAPPSVMDQLSVRAKLATIKAGLPAEGKEGEQPADQPSKTPIEPPAPKDETPIPPEDQPPIEEDDETPETGPKGQDLVDTFTDENGIIFERFEGPDGTSTMIQRDPENKDPIQVIKGDKDVILKRYTEQIDKIKKIEEKPPVDTKAVKAKYLDDYVSYLMDDSQDKPPAEPDISEMSLNNLRRQAKEIALDRKRKDEKPPEDKKPPKEKKTATDEIEDIDIDDLDDLLDEADEGEAPAETPTPPPPRDDRPPVDDNRPPVDRPPAEAGEVSNDNVDKLKDLFPGLGAPTQLGSPAGAEKEPAFSKEKYAAATPVFVSSIKDMSAGGKTLKDFLSWAIKSFGSDIKPYLKQFVVDVKAGKINLKEEDKADTPPPPPPGPQDNTTRIRALILSDASMQQKSADMKKMARELDISDKAVQEMVEAELVRMARKIIVANDTKPGNTDAQTMKDLIALYEKQPIFSARSSGSVSRQAYSTPLPLAFAIERMIDAKNGSKVYEPTAGMGALVIDVDPKKVDVNEIDSVRVQELKKNGYNQVTSNDASLQPPADRLKSYDKVIMNPPFGTRKDGAMRWNGFRITQLDHEIALRTLDQMTDNGQAAIILGASLHQSDELTRKDRALLNAIMNNFNVVDNFEVSGDLYRKQGASFPTRVLIISGRKPATEEQLAPKKVDRLNTWREIEDRIEGNKNESKRIRDIVESERRSKTTDGPGEGGEPPQGPRRIPESTGEPPIPTDTGVDRGGDTGGSEDAGGSSDERTDGTRHSKRKKPPLPETISESEHRKRRESDSGVEKGRRGGTTARDKHDFVRRGEPRDHRVDPLKVPGENDIVNIDEFTSTYVPFSRAPGLDTVSPRYMALPMFRAMKELTDQVGDLDYYLVDKLGYDNVQHLWDGDNERSTAGLAAEQIDSIAQTIYQIEANKAGMIVADETGIGKGRQAAALMRYAIREGKMPVFFTATPKLFSDMYGDLQDIDTTLSPLLVGSQGKAEVKDVDDKVIVAYEAKQKQIMKRYLDGDEDALKEFDSIFATYSQINAADNIQQRFFQALSERDDVFFIMDESHKGAGQTSTTGVYLRGGETEKKDPQTKETIKTEYPGALRSDGVSGVTYLSATYAKNPQAMGLYFWTDISKAANTPEDLEFIFENGGVPIQQVSSAALAETGQLVRREKSFDGVKFEQEDIKMDERERAELIADVDEVTSILGDIVDYSNRAIDVMGTLPDYLVKKRNSVQTQLQTTTFASVVHNKIAQLMYSMKLKYAVEEAIATHKRGEKPVLAVVNTMESFLEDYVRKNHLSEGDTVDVNFADTLKTALDRTMRASVEGPTGDNEHIEFTPEQLGMRSEYDELMADIDALELDLPASPIDWLRHELEKADISTGELTGRSLMLEYQDDGTAILRSRTPKERADKNGPTNAFNRGDIDAIILNKSGSTGISLHAAEKFDDHKKRRMIVVDAHPDINEFKQILGRIKRSGMIEPDENGVAAASYIMLKLPLESENRPFAVINQKMKSLNALTTAGADADLDVKAVDILNKYGNQAASEMLFEDDELTDKLRMSSDVNMNEEGGLLAANQRLVLKFTGRLALLTNKEQAEVWEDLLVKYNEIVALEKSTGQYDLEVAVHDDWDAELVDEAVLEEGEDSSSIFTSDVVLSQYDIKDTRKPPSLEEVQSAYNESFGPDSRPHVVKKGLIDSLNEASAKAIGEEPAFEAEKKAVAEPVVETEEGEDAPAEKKEPKGPVESAEHKNYVKKKELADQVRENMNDLLSFTFKHIGKGVLIEVGDESYEGVITSITHKPTKKGIPGRASKYRIEVMINSPLRKLVLPLSKIQNGDVTLSDIPGNQSLSDTFSEDHRTAENRVRRYVMTGNVMRAIPLTEGKGSIVTFRNDKEQDILGLLMPQSWSPSQLGRDPRNELNSGEAVRIWMEKYAHTSDNVSTGGDLVIQKQYDDRYTVNVPASKNGQKYYLDQGLLEITGEFNKSSKRQLVRVDKETMEKVANYVINEMKENFVPNRLDPKQIDDANGRAPADGGVAATSGQTEQGASKKKKKKESQTPRIDPDPIKGQKPKNVRQAVLDLTNALGKKIYNSKVPKKFAGVYYTDTGNISIKATDHLDTIAHEIAHSLDDRYGIVAEWAGNYDKSPFDEELRHLWVYGSVTKTGARAKLIYKRAEGVAEWVRAYIMNPEEAKALAPKFHDFIKEKVPKEAWDAIEQFSVDVRVLAGATGEEKVLARITTPEDKEGFLSRLRNGKRGPLDMTLWDKFSQTFIDSRTMSNKAFALASDIQGGVLPDDDPRLMANIYLGIISKIEDVFDTGMINHEGVKLRSSDGQLMNLKWLYSALDNTSEETIAAEAKATTAFMIAQRTIEKSAILGKRVISGIGSGIGSDVDVARQTIEELEEDPKKAKRVKEAARRYREFADSILRYMVDKGRMSEKDYDKIKEQNEYYVAMHRVMEISTVDPVVFFKPARGGGDRIGNIIMPGSLKKFKGSDKMLEDPYPALMDTLVKGMREADRNEIMLFFRNLLVSDRNGLYSPGLDKAERLSDIGHKVSLQDTGNTIDIWVDGKKERWQFPNEDVYKSLKGLCEAPTPYKAWATISGKMLRAGIINMPQFAIRNVIRDFQHRLQVSDADLMTSLKNTFKLYGPQDVSDLMTFGGDMAGPYLRSKADYIRSIEAAMREVAADPNAILVNPVELAKFAAGKYKKLMESSERIGRIAEFKSSYAYAREKLGYTKYQAQLYAGDKARGLIDFAVMGTWIREINSLIPFTGAAVRGLVVTAEAFKKNKKRFTMIWALTSLLPSILARLMASATGDDEEYQQLPPYLRDMFFNFKVGPNTWLRIPKNFEMGVLGAIGDRMVDQMMGNKNAWEGYMGSVAKGFLPVDETAVAGAGLLKGIAEVRSNYDWFRDKNIIPTDEKDSLLEFRHTERGSRLGQALQKIIGVDSRNVDHLMRATFGIAGSTAVRLSNAGRKDKQGPGLKELGVFTSSPAYEAMDVQWVQTQAKELGVFHRRDYKGLQDTISQYFEARSGARRDLLAKRVRREARRIRRNWERVPPRVSKRR